MAKIADGAEAYSALTQFFRNEKQETKHLSADWFCSGRFPIPVTRRTLAPGAAQLVLEWWTFGPTSWARLAAKTQKDAPDICDVVVLQEAHWEATTAFYVSGKYSVSLISPEPQPGARCPKPTCTAVAVPWVAGFGYGPPSCVRYCPVTDGVRQCYE